MRQATVIPLALSAVMAALLLWMLQGHGATFGWTQLLPLSVFVAAHVVVVMAALVTPIVVVPPLRRLAVQVHRPGPLHASLLVAAVAAGSLLLHLILHLEGF